MGFRIAVDTGGTFSDVVATDQESGQIWVGKAPTTPDRIFEGISAALGEVARELDLSVSGLLNSAEVFIYGTTSATNAIVTGKTARTAFVTTAGHPDTLVLREGGKSTSFNFRQAYPDPYIPKRFTFEVQERVTAAGEVLVPIDEEGAQSTLETAVKSGIEAIAVCLLWSIANPIHEIRIGELIKEIDASIPFTLSHQLNPIIREYRRASSTAIDASLKPLMQRHISALSVDLRNAGFEGELLLGTSTGGVLGVDDIIDRPIYTVNSAPAMAPVAGRYHAQGEPTIVVCDMGGTSFDVSLVRDGYIKFTRETWLGGKFVGHMTGLSAVDIRNIGAGGGSIAWLDSGVLLRVGPQSAGAQPGPACYDKGGTEPTVTDAALLLGYLDADYFLGGRVALSIDKARTAVREAIAEPLGLEMSEAADAMMSVANEHMVTAIRDITINEGVDPRDSLIVAGGGAGGMTICRIADELGCTRVLVPKVAGNLSASGGLLSDIVREFSVSNWAETSDFPRIEVNEVLDALSEEMEAFFEELGTPLHEQQREYFVEARYPYQVWELEVPLVKARFDDELDIDKMVESFHEVHERVFAVHEPGQTIECVYWKARATAKLPKPIAPVHSVHRLGTAEPRSRKTAWFGRPLQNVGVYRGEDMFAGNYLSGPAIVQETTTTVVVYPNWSLNVTARGDYLLEKEGGA